ncbi:MAG: hypothetical protein PHD33_06665 [Atribacterota bacterium]|nr:hypothetical protein [Atribacterota bacterium]
MKIKLCHSHKSLELKKDINSFFPKALAFILITFIVMYGLCAIQMGLEDGLERGNITQDYANAHINFNTSSPTLEGAFLSSYVHNTADYHQHLNGNIQWYFLWSMAILLILGIRHWLGKPLPKYFISALYLILFIGLPFIVAGFSLCILKSFDKYSNELYGFSGIACAITGVTLALLISTIKVELGKMTWKKGVLEVIIILFLFSAFLLLLFADPIGQLSHGTNIFGHCIGFVIGIFAAMILENLLTKIERKRKINESQPL